MLFAHDEFYLLSISLFSHRHNDLADQFRVFAKNKVYSINLKADTRRVWNRTLAQTDIPRLRAGRLGAQVGFIL